MNNIIICILILLPSLSISQDCINLMVPGADENGTFNFIVDPSNELNQSYNWNDQVCFDLCAKYIYEYTVVGDCPGCPAKTSTHIVDYYPCDKLDGSIEYFKIENENDDCMYYINVNIDDCHNVYSLDWSNGETSESFIATPGLYEVTITSDLNPNCTFTTSVMLPDCEDCLPITGSVICNF